MAGRGEAEKALTGQIWRLPYLVDGWFERVVGKNAINENQYKSAGFGS